MPMEFNIFGESEIGGHFRIIEQSIEEAIQKETENYILNVNQIEYIDHLIDKFTVQNIVLYPDQLYASTYETDIPAESHPSEYFVMRGKTYKRQVVRFHIPFEGNTAFLRYVPSKRILWSIPVLLENGSIAFDLINWNDNAESLKQEAQHIVSNITRQSANVSAEITTFNNLIPQLAKNAFESRKNKYLKKNQFMSNLGVPVHKRTDSSTTFSIPPPQIRKPIVVNKPAVTSQKFQPEPSLDEATYQSILKIIFEVGRQFERMPSTYINKSEEDLRDHFLLFLEPNFEGSATGETFNKTGKTDILLRYEGKNVFIAECKFWRGTKGFVSTITQLIHYLTWRDSKAAIMLFVDNKDFTNVLSQIEQSASTHPNFLGSIGKSDETWFNFRFHIEGDRNREIKLAVLVFHFPELKK